MSYICREKEREKISTERVLRREFVKNAEYYDIPGKYESHFVSHYCFTRSRVYAILRLMLIRGNGAGHAILCEFSMSEAGARLVEMWFARFYK